MASTVILVAKVALTAYSAVNAVKSLSDGNIMGAVMSGFGAYMGLSNLTSAFGAAQGDVLASSASQGQMLAEQTAEFGAEGAGMTADALGVLEGGPLVDSGLEVMKQYEKATPVLGQAGADSLNIGERLQLNVGSEGGIMGDIGSTIEGGWDQLVKAGKAVVDMAGNLVSTEDGSILAKAGEAVGGMGMGDIMKGGSMALNYLGKEKEREAQEKAAEEGYQRSVAEAKRKRASIGAAPDYVYDFGRGTA